MLMMVVLICLGEVLGLTCKCPSPAGALIFLKVIASDQKLLWLVDRVRQASPPPPQFKFHDHHYPMCTLAYHEAGNQDTHLQSKMQMMWKLQSCNVEG